MINKLEHRYVILDSKKYFLTSDYNYEGKRVNHLFIDETLKFKNKGDVMKNILILGAARSGKTSLAKKLAKEIGERGD